MYLVTAKTKATAQDFPGSTVEWAVGQTREVHDSLIQEFKNNPAAWTVSGGATTSTVTTTSSAGGSVLLHPETAPIKRGSPLSLPLRIVGLPSVSSLTNVTRHCTRALRVPFSAWRATVHHIGSATPDYKVGIATGADPADLYGNELTPSLATFGGAASGSAVAASGTPPDHQFSTLVSDLMFASSAPGDSLIYIRTNANLANNTKFDLSIDLKGLDTYGYQTAYQGSVDAVTAWSGFNSPTLVNGFPPVTIELFGASAIRKFGIFGSSTAHGTGDTTHVGWAWRTELALNALGNGIAYSLANLSAPSSTTAASYARALKEISERSYHAAVFWIYSTNDSDSGTAAGDARRKGQAVGFIEACRAEGVYPILATFQSASGMSGQQYASCKVANAFVRQLAAAGHCGCFDVAAQLSDESAATPTWKSATYTTDLTHPNAVGYIVLKDYGVPYFRDLIP